MSLAIYKSGQGIWTRSLSAAGLGAVILAGVQWLCVDELAAYDLYVRMGIGLAIVAVGGFGVYFASNRPAIADFLIATEAEMRKVNWPSRREVVGSTWIVICGTFLMAGLMFIIDLVFIKLFTLIKIIDTGN